MGVAVHAEDSVVSDAPPSLAYGRDYSISEFHSK